jgi:hypothetical protein
MEPKLQGRVDPAKGGRALEMSYQRIDMRHLAQEARRRERDALWWLSFVAMAVTFILAAVLW